MCCPAPHVPRPAPVFPAGAPRGAVDDSLAARPDAWVIADTPAGCAQLARRLAGQPGWAPDRTFGFAGLARPDLVALAGPALTGMSGPTASGGAWRIAGHLLVRDEARRPARPKLARADRTEVR
jgi:hypothetical protein